MLPVNFPESNQPFTKPDGWKDEDCFDLSAYNGFDENGKPVVITKWQPSKEDIEAINNGDGIWVWVVGGLPPMLLSTENPFIKTEN